MRAGGNAPRSGHLVAPWKDEYQNVWGSDKHVSGPVSEDAELGELSIAAHQFDYLDKVLNPSDWLTADKFLKLAAITTAKTEDTAEDPKTFYDPEGFFDNISCEAKTNETGQNRTRQHEKKLNAETFNLPQRQPQRFRYPQQGAGTRGPNATPRRATRGGGANNSNNNARPNNNTSRNGPGQGGQGQGRQVNTGRSGQGGAPQQRHTQNGGRNNAQQHQQQQQQAGRRRGPSNGRRFGGNNNQGNRQAGKGQFVPSRVSENLVEFVSKLPMMVANDNGVGASGSLGMPERAGSNAAPTQFKWTFPTAAGSDSVSDENNGDFDFVRDKGLTVDGVAH
jgi:hypothetical protein